MSASRPSHAGLGSVRKVYHGWWVVAGLFLILTVSSGFGFYNHSVYLNALSADGAFSVADVSVAISFYFLAGGIAGIGVARLIDQVEVRRIMIIGAAVAGIALTLLGQARELWHLHGLFMLFGIGNTGVSIVIATTLVTRWFPGRNRSIALSLASTGLSFGGVVFTPMTAFLLDRMAFEPVAAGLGAAFFLLPAHLLRRQRLRIDGRGQRTAGLRIGLRRRRLRLCLLGGGFNRLGGLRMHGRSWSQAQKLSPEAEASQHPNIPVRCRPSFGTHLLGSGQCEESSVATHRTKARSRLTSRPCSTWCSSC